MLRARMAIRLHLGSFMSLFFTVLAQNYNVVQLGSLSWTVSSQNVSVPGKVPSLAHLDLLAAGIIEEPVYGYRDFEYTWLAYGNFTYTSGSVTGLSRNASLSTKLIFEGLDTLADIFFCGQHIANVSNQFRKWTYDISNVLAKCNSTPVVEVAFRSAPLVSARLEQQDHAEKGSNCLECFGTQFQFPGRQFLRKEQSDYGWDWAPGFAPQGIWKPGRIVQLPKSPSRIKIEDLFVDSYRVGQVNNLVPDQLNPFVLNTSVDYIGTLPDNIQLQGRLLDASGGVFWQGNFSGIERKNQSITGSTILQREPDLWWPAGHGQQTMYNLTVVLVSIQDGSSLIASAERRIGFRTIVLNQSPVNTEQKARGINVGDNWHFEINGHEIYAKGANFVPPDPFWPRITKNDIDILFSSAIAANFNMLRIWSSSIYMPDFVYDLADDYGLMLWSELQFSDSFYPIDTAFVDDTYQEVSENVRRINSHPSLALWCGGNELELLLLIAKLYAPDRYLASLTYYEDMFLDVLLHAVFDNTRSISYIGGSTTLGYTSFDYNRSRPIKERYPYNTNTGPTWGDADFYSYNVPVAFNQSTYNASSNAPLNSRFINEFGFHSHSSYETYSLYFPPSELSFNSSLMVHRNRHFPIEDSALAPTDDGTGGPYVDSTASLAGLGQMSYASELYYPIPHKRDNETQFRMQIYATQLFQAEMLRYEIDLYRRGSGQPQRTLGSLYWMLNDIWAAPTWSSIETGGRWKILHHLARDAYSPLVIHPFVDDSNGIFSISVTSDLWEAVSGTASLTWYDWAGNELNNVSKTWSFFNQPVNVGAINSTQIFSRARNSLPHDFETAVAVLRSNFSQPDGSSHTTERFFTAQHLSANATMQAFRDPRLTVAYDAGDDLFVVESNAIAAFVWLSQPSSAKGYFTKNAFWMLPGQTTVKFVPYVGQGQAAAGWQNEVSIMSVWNLTTS